jgi:hypothetical protein
MRVFYALPLHFAFQTHNIWGGPYDGTQHVPSAEALSGAPIKELLWE